MYLRATFFVIFCCPSQGDEEKNDEVKLKVYLFIFIL